DVQAPARGRARDGAARQHELAERRARCAGRRERCAQRDRRALRAARAARRRHAKRQGHRDRLGRRDRRRRRRVVHAGALRRRAGRRAVHGRRRRLARRRPRDDRERRGGRPAPHRGLHAGVRAADARLRRLREAPASPRRRRGRDRRRADAGSRGRRKQRRRRHVAPDARAPPRRAALRRGGRSMSVPRFAVVGHPNKGKSSIVATLAEDDAVQISPLPGTTSAARSYPLRVDGETLYELIDTPGFQRPRAVLDWLKRHDRGVEARPAVVAELVAQHRDDPLFHDECELLAPIVEGAGILYVVDGSRPYGREDEAEMEVLRWTGRPRMALINMIGSGDYVAEWQRALGQYFASVRVFAAQRAAFERRIELLRAFGALDESWQPQLSRAADVLIAERARRRKRAALEIAALLRDALTMTERAPTE